MWKIQKILLSINNVIINVLFCFIRNSQGKGSNLMLKDVA
jgi:hypothetical protein